MKLIFDEHFSPKLVAAFRSQFPGSIYVLEVGAPPISDRSIWDFARANGFVIVTKDSDFQHLAYLHGHPPRVIWLRCGNAATPQIQELLRSNLQRIAAFENDRDAAVLLLP